MSEPNKKIGYILARELGQNAFIGGLLVTDEKGFPVEFRYTDPVTPSKLQRIIYGNALDKYLIVEVIARSLLESLHDKPGLFITDSKLILEMSEVLSAPLISIQESGQSPLPEMGHVKKLDNGEILMQIHPSGGPAHITYAGSEDGFEKVQPLIAELGNEMDILEPLKRISSALKEIMENSDEPRKK